MSAYLITDEVINWLLFGTLLWLLAWMLLRFEKEDLEEGEEAVPRRIPSEAGILIGLLMVWALAAWFNARLMGAIPGFDTPHFFPFSIFIPRFNVDGLAYTALLLGLIGIALRYHRCWSLGQIWLIGLGVLVIGNLIQGDFDRGFLQPLYVTNFQYYHDALAIRDPWLWLTSFNEQQPQLQIHARTHPPFAVLLHYPLLPDVMQRPVALALLFTLISSLAVPLFWATARAAGVEQDQARLLTLLLASVPAVNIYGAISLDGVILAFSLLFTFGLIKLWKRGWSLQGVVALVVGLLGVMAFTFLVAFHLALLAAVALWQWRREGARSLLAAAAVALGAAGLAMLLLWLVADYNHVQAFFTASRLENPDGFLALAEPTLYAMTRLEALLELLIFFSIPVAVVWLQGLWRGGWRMNGAGDVLSLLVLLILFAILLTGAFRTGEIARASLFVYPWLLLTLGRLDDSKLSRLVLLSGVQLALMQSLGYYFW
jgi:hypothetical protein